MSKKRQYSPWLTIGVMTHDVESLKSAVSLAESLPSTVTVIYLSEPVDFLTMPIVLTNPQIK